MSADCVVQAEHVQGVVVVVVVQGVVVVVVVVQGVVVGVVVVQGVVVVVVGYQHHLPVSGNCSCYPWPGRSEVDLLVDTSKFITRSSLKTIKKRNEGNKLMRPSKNDAGGPEKN